jgi:hypothetical protein
VLLTVVAAWVGCVHAQDGADGDKKGAKKGPASKKVAGKDQSFFRLVVTGACRQPVCLQFDSERGGLLRERTRASALILSRILRNKQQL